MNANKFTRFLKKNSPVILLGVGLLNFGVSTFFTVKATIKATKIKEAMPDDVSKKDVAKAVWKLYIPSALSFILGGTSVVLSYRINTKRNAALSTALLASQTTLANYQNAIEDKYGKEGAQDIRNAVASKQSGALPNPEYLEMIDNGMEVECYEASTQRRFMSTKDRILELEGRLNEERLHNPFGTITFNDMYVELGLEETSTGDFFGWTESSDPVRFHISAIEKEGIPFLYIEPENWVFVDN